MQQKLIPCSESTRPPTAVAVVQPIPQPHRILKYACASPLCKGAMMRQAIIHAQKIRRVPAVFVGRYETMLIIK